MQYRDEPRLCTYAFDSLREATQWIEDTKPTWRTRDSRNAGWHSWDLGADYETALRMAREGWLEGAQRAQETLRAFAPQTPMPQDKVDFYGYRPHVPRYCAGAPDSMIRRAMAETGSGKVLTLYVAINALGEVSAEAMSNFGVAVAQYVNQLETDGTRVELHAACCSVLRNGISLAHSVQLKRADQPLDLAVVAFAIGHPAMFRRIVFALRERAATPHSGYGSSRYMTAEDIINPPAGAVFLNGMQDADIHAGTPEAALAYVSKQIETALEAQ